MAVGPTNSSPLAPLSGGDRGRLATQQGRDVTGNLPKGGNLGANQSR